MNVSAAPRVVLPVTVPIVDDPTDAVKKLFVVGSYDDGGTFSLVLEVYTEFDFFNHPKTIFNMNETGFQLNNEAGTAGTVIETRGAKDVHTRISSDRGENISIIACCSAEGRLLPPVIVLNGKGKKMHLAMIYQMVLKLFKRLKEHFALCKSCGRTVLIPDGHSSGRIETVLKCNARIS
ncbi:hypothetical protein QE152_g39356 [Popillia japonica]|uniref:Uncharacterized protein n=1 Tax=Popillia japonica TaxID=7064 RepID=A0AAW1HU17_POPJA